MEWLHLLKQSEKVKWIFIQNDFTILTGDTPISVRYMFDHQEEFQIGERHSQDK